MGFGLYIPIRGVKISGMVLEWRLFSYFTVCSFKDLYKNFTAVVFF